MLDCKILLPQSFRLRKDHIGYVENSLGARLESRDLRLRVEHIDGKKSLLAYHRDSLMHRFRIPIEEEIGGENPKYEFAPYFHANLSVHFSKEKLEREVKGALALYSKYELE